MHNHEVNESYGLPQVFYEVIHPYIEGSGDGESRQVAETPSELLTIWRAALSARDKYPELGEHIAEWAMSAGASSPLINDAQYEDIHVRFGQAEVSAKDDAEQWATLKKLVDEAAIKSEVQNTSDIED